jgi:hypothetical protein
MTESFQPTEAFAAANEATERATQQVRDFGEQAAATTKNFGNLALDTYERAVATYVEFEQKAAEAAPVDWMKTAIEAHVSLVRNLNDVYVKAARSALAS